MCTGLQQLEFAAGFRLRMLEARACHGCRSLQRISFPASTEVLGRRCFRLCSELQEVRFEAGSKLRQMEAEAFANCGLRMSIFVPNSVKGNPGLELSGASEQMIVWC
jgi:hypothetical protein